MAKKSVYVVIGTTGEYSDHQEWPVKAFMTEGAAKRWVELASARARELGVYNSNSKIDYDIRHKIHEKANKYDPDMQVDYTGVNYYYWKVKLDG